MNTVNHFCVKIMADAGSRIEWAKLIPVFHRWIQEGAVPGLLIDVADYSHVPRGPGVMLIGHEGFYSVDNRCGEPGLLYQQRSAIEGSTREKLARSFEYALPAARRLESEPEFAGKLRFNGNDCEVFVNDRLGAPNTEETFASVGVELQSFFEERWPNAAAELTWDSDPRCLFRVRISARIAVPA